MFSHFDHPLIDDAEIRYAERLRAERLWAQLAREYAPAADDGPLEWLEVSVIETPPDVAREAIESAPIHPLDSDAPRRTTTGGGR